MRPVNKLDIQIAPDHRPKRLVVPRPHQIEDRSILTHCRTQLIHLDPVKRFLLRIVDGEKTLRIILVPPLLMSGNESFVFQQFLRILQIFLDRR